MNVKIAPFAATVVLLIVAGCSAQSDDADGSSDGAGALSASDCTKKADDEKASALSDCQKANAFDVAACEKPSDDALAKWEAATDAAYQAVADKIDPITGTCKANVDAMACKDLLTQVGKDFAAAADDQKACDALRATRKTKCDSDASDAIKQAIGSDDAYNTLMDQQASVETNYLAGILSCQTQNGMKTLAAASCPAQAEVKRESAYLACRRQCPVVKGAACTPDDYKGQDVECGKISTVSSDLGLFCESGTQCSRTPLCDQYDQAKTDADKINKANGCQANGAAGVLVPVLTFHGTVDAQKPQPPNAVTTECQPLPRAATIQDAGAPDSTDGG